MGVAIFRYGVSCLGMDPDTSTVSKGQWITGNSSQSLRIALPAPLTMPILTRLKLYLPKIMIQSTRPRLSKPGSIIKISNYSHGHPPHLI